MNKKYFPILITIVIFSIILSACAASNEYLSVGENAPDFTLSDVNDGEFTLYDELGDNPMLLYFSMADG